MPERENQPTVELKESEPLVAELEALFDAFEAKHPVDELFLITDLEAKDAPKHPVRHPANMDLIPIVRKLEDLRTKTDISADKLAKLQAKYKRISQAVGIINRGRVDHTR